MMMKISNDTVNVLRNFATVNSSLAVKQGSVLRTISEQKNILVQAVVNESFPGTGCHGVPFISSICNMLNCSVVSFLLIALHLIIPIFVPTICSFV